MTDHKQYATNRGSAAQSCRLWSDHVDALDRHLSANTWALWAVTMVVVAYPIARIVMPAAFHDIVPEVVRTVLNLI